MKYYKVKFINSYEVNEGCTSVSLSSKDYFYKSELPLKKQDIYSITTDQTYSNPVMIIDVYNKVESTHPIKTIVEAIDITSNKVKKPVLEKPIIYINDNKGTVACKWADGTTTKAKTSEDDAINFNPEMGIALCYLKHFIPNVSQTQLNKAIFNAETVDSSKK